MMNHKALIAAVIALIATTASGAPAGQWYKSANEHAMYCSDPHLALEVLHGVDAERLRMLECPDGTGTPACAELSADQPFGINRGDPSDDSPKEIYLPRNRIASAIYIAGHIVPTSAPHQEIAGCKSTDIGPNGEVDRWIIEPDGTPKLKRFMITSKCINGQMMSRTKRLN